MRSYPVRVKVGGDLALFSRPEYPTEPVSYPCMTPSAARGLLSSIFWKPGMEYSIQRIVALRRGDYITVMRNHVKEKMQMGHPYLCVNDHRTQRIFTMLRDVEYIIEADVTSRIWCPYRASEAAAIFHDRVEKGQFYRMPVLGTAECFARIEPVTGEETPCDWTEDLGSMVHTIHYKTRKVDFFHARVVKGVLEITSPYSVSEERESREGQAVIL